MPDVNVKGRYRIYTHDGVEPLLFTSYATSLCSIRRPNPNTFITISQYIPGSLSPFTTFDPGSSYTIVTKSNIANFSMGPYTRADRLPASVTFRSPNFYHGLDKNSITVALSSYALSVNSPLSTAFTYIPNQDGYVVNSISFDTARYKQGLPSLLTHLTPNSSYQFKTRTPFTFFAPLQSEMSDLYITGLNDHGHIGMGHLYRNTVQEQLFGKWDTISTSVTHSIALSTCGNKKKIFVCGGNQLAQLGFSTMSIINTIGANEYVTYTCLDFSNKAPGSGNDSCPNASYIDRDFRPVWTELKQIVVYDFLSNSYTNIYNSVDIVAVEAGNGCTFLVDSNGVLYGIGNIAALGIQDPGAQSTFTAGGYTFAKYQIPGMCRYYQADYSKYSSSQLNYGIFGRFQYDYYKDANNVYANYDFYNGVYDFFQFNYLRVGPDLSESESDRYGSYIPYFSKYLSKTPGVTELGIMNNVKKIKSSYNARTVILKNDGTLWSNYLENSNVITNTYYRHFAPVPLLTNENGAGGNFRDFDVSSTVLVAQSAISSQSYASVTYNYPQYAWYLMGNASVYGQTLSQVFVLRSLSGIGINNQASSSTENYNDVRSVAGRGDLTLYAGYQCYFGISNNYIDNTQDFYVGGYGFTLQKAQEIFASSSDVKPAHRYLGYDGTNLQAYPFSPYMSARTFPETYGISLNLLNQKNIREGLVNRLLRNIRTIENGRYAGRERILSTLTSKTDPNLQIKQLLVNENGLIILRKDGVIIKTGYDNDYNRAYNIYTPGARIINGTNTFSSGFKTSSHLYVSTTDRFAPTPPPTPNPTPTPSPIPLIPSDAPNTLLVSRLSNNWKNTGDALHSIRSSDGYETITEQFNWLTCTAAGTFNPPAQFTSANPYALFYFCFDYKDNNTIVASTLGQNSTKYFRSLKQIQKSIATGSTQYQLNDICTNGTTVAEWNSTNPSSVFIINYSLMQNSCGCIDMFIHRNSQYAVYIITNYSINSENAPKGAWTFTHSFNTGITTAPVQISTSNVCFNTSVANVTMGSSMYTGTDGTRSTTARPLRKLPDGTVICKYLYRSGAFGTNYGATAHIGRYDTSTWQGFDSNVSYEIPNSGDVNGNKVPFWPEFAKLSAKYYLAWCTKPYPAPSPVGTVTEVPPDLILRDLTTNTQVTVDTQLCDATGLGISDNSSNNMQPYDILGIPVENKIYVVYSKYITYAGSGSRNNVVGIFLKRYDSALTLIDTVELYRISSSTISTAQYAPSLNCPIFSYYINSQKVLKLILAFGAKSSGSVGNGVVYLSGYFDIVMTNTPSINNTWTIKYNNYAADNKLRISNYGQRVISI